MKRASSSADFPHLTPVAAAIAVRPAADRRAAMHRPIWVDHSGAVEILQDLRPSLVAVRRADPPVVRLLAGPANSGKTTIAERLVIDAPPVEDGNGDIVRVPVIKVRARGYGRGEDMIALSVVRQLVPSYPARQFTRLECDAARFLGLFAVRLLIVDDCDSLEEGNGLGGVMAGVGRLLQAGSCDALLVSRTVAAPRLVEACRHAIHPIVRTYEAPRLVAGAEETRAFLAGLESTLPLRRRSELGSAPMMRRLCVLSDGRLGHLTEIVRDAAVAALDQGREQISLKTLPQPCGTDFSASGQRRSRDLRPRHRFEDDARYKMPRRWPSWLNPQVDETVWSWAERATTWFERDEIGEVLRDFMGTPDRIATGSLRDCGLWQAWIETLVRHAGLDEARLRGLDFPGEAYQRFRDDWTGRSVWPAVDRLLGCPACLAADRIPYRRRRWQSPWAIACMEHGLCLVPVRSVSPARAPWAGEALGWGPRLPVGTMASAAQHALDDALAGRDVDLGWIQLQPEAYVHGLRAVAQFLDRHDARYRALEAAKGRTAPQARMAVLHDRMRAWPLFVRGLFDAATPISAAELESVWDRLPPLVLRAVSIDEIRQLPEEFRDGLVEPGLVKRPIHVRRQLVGGLIQLLPEPRNRTTTLHIADIGRARRRALLLQLLAWLRGEPIPPMPVPAPTPPPVAGREPIGRQQRLLDLVVRNDLPPGRAILRARRKLAMRRALGWCRRHPEAVAGLEGPALERALTALLRAASRPTWIPMGRSMPPPAVAGPRARAPGRLGSGSARSLDA